MTSQIRKQIIAIHILPNISRTKGSQANLKLGQLIEYNLRNIFLQKSCCFPTWPRRLNKNLNTSRTKRAFNI